MFFLLRKLSACYLADDISCQTGKSIHQVDFFSRSLQIFEPDDELVDHGLDPRFELLERAFGEEV